MKLLSSSVCSLLHAFSYIWCSNMLSVVLFTSICLWRTKCVDCFSIFLLLAHHLFEAPQLISCLDFGNGCCGNGCRIFITLPIARATLRLSQNGYGFTLIISHKLICHGIEYLFSASKSISFLSRMDVQGSRAVVLGNLQAQTVFILASFQMCFW